MTSDATPADETNPGEEDANPAKSEKAKTTRASADKWGREVLDLGFCVLPSLVFRAQRRLGLNLTQLAVLLQLADFWWAPPASPSQRRRTWRNASA